MGLGGQAHNCILLTHSMRRINVAAYNPLCIVLIFQPSSMIKKKKKKLDPGFFTPELNYQGIFIEKQL